MAVTAVKPSKNGVKKTSEKQPTTPVVAKAKNEVPSLEEKIEHFEKLKGFTSKRERLVGTLSKLNKFVYNQDHSVSFQLVDSSGQDFKTSNTELVKIIVKALKTTLEVRKGEVEKEIMGFTI